MCKRAITKCLCSGPTRTGHITKRLILDNSVGFCSQIKVKLEYHQVVESYSNNKTGNFEVALTKRTSLSKANCGGFAQGMLNIVLYE